MSTPERNLFISERDAFLQGITIPEPDEFYYNLKPVNVERAVALLESWCNEDDSDEPQAETVAYLKRVLHIPAALTSVEGRNG